MMPRNFGFMFCSCVIMEFRFYGAEGSTEGSSPVLSTHQVHFSVATMSMSPFVSERNWKNKDKYNIMTQEP